MTTNVRIESGSTDKPKLPTLRQCFEKIGRGEYSLCTAICTIFVNSRFENFTLVTEDGYRVILYKGTKLHAYFESELEDLADDGQATLWVFPSTEKAGEFTLEVDKSQDPVWRHFEWGYAIEGSNEAQKLFEVGNRKPAPEIKAVTEPTGKTATQKNTAL